MAPYQLLTQPCELWAQIVSVAIMPLFVMARWVPSDESHRLAGVVREELDATYPRKVSADILRLKESDLSLQLNGAEPLNFYRLAALGPCFWNRILKRLARMQGGEYLEPEVVTLLNGAAQLKKPMASMEMPTARKREIA